MSDEFSGFVNKPKEEQKEIADKWVEESNKKLEEYDLDWIITKKKSLKFVKRFAVFALIVFIIVAGVFAYLAYQNKFTSTVSQIISPIFNPNVNVTNNFENDFNPTTNNQYAINLNVTIVNNIKNSSW